MKKLNITSNNCKVSTSSWGDVYVNGEKLAELIADNMPAMEEYKEYPAEISISIKVKDFDEIKISTEGYDIKDEKNEGKEAQDSIEINNNEESEATEKEVI